MIQQQPTEQEVNQHIDQAIKRIGAKRENELCRYLPGPNGGYIHHFTLKKMKTEAPAKLIFLLREFILAHPDPKKLPHKPRAPRGSRKRLELLNFSRQDMDRLLQVVLKEGDTELLKKLTPKPTLKSLKRQLIQSIKMERADASLWNAYMEQVQVTHGHQAMASV